MGIGPGIGRRLDRSLLERDIVRGAICALLMVALAWRDLPLPLVILLPLVTYAGLCLIATARTEPTSLSPRERRQASHQVCDRPVQVTTPNHSTMQVFPQVNQNGLTPDPLSRVDARAPAPERAESPVLAMADQSNGEVKARSAEPIHVNGNDPAASPGNRLEQPQKGGEATATLTPRKLEVLRLLARGRSNKEIAEDLFISDKTVKTHVQNILHKLELPSRSAAAGYAHQHGLV